MKKNRLLVMAAAAYMILLVCVAIFYVMKGQSNYLTYKDQIKAVAQKEENKPIQTKPVEEKTEEKETEKGAENNDSTNVNTKPDSTINTENTYDKVEYTRLLRVGSLGEDVKKIQDVLKKKSLYTGEISGNFDEKTREAVKKFQTESKLSPDGMVGKGTWTKLIASNIE